MDIEPINCMKLHSLHTFSCQNPEAEKMPRMTQAQRVAGWLQASRLPLKFLWCLACDQVLSQGCGPDFKLLDQPMTSQGQEDQGWHPGHKIDLSGFPTHDRDQTQTATATVPAIPGLCWVSTHSPELSQWVQESSKAPCLQHCSGTSALMVETALFTRASWLACTSMVACLVQWWIKISSSLPWWKSPCAQTKRWVKFKMLHARSQSTWRWTYDGKAAISITGQSTLVRVNRALDTASDEILTTQVPIIQALGGRLHTAWAMTPYLHVNDVDILDWPSQSPDLYPIEHLWVELDCHVH